jgi:hypothetical protein
VDWTKTGWTATASRLYRRGFGDILGEAQVAQLVEHATENRSVGGSIPSLGTTQYSLLLQILSIILRRELGPEFQGLRRPRERQLRPETGCPR